MDNMGGLNRLFIIDADDYVSLAAGEDGIYTLTLENGATLTEIEFSQGKGKISESEEQTDHGTVYNFEITARIPKCGVGNINPFGDLKHKKIIILGVDNNDNYWLTGSPGSYFNINTNSSTGEDPQDMNARQLKISSVLMTGSVFINSPL